MDEKNYIQCAKKGDVEAFASLMQLYEKKIYNIAYRIMGSREDAFDIAQEAMIKIFQSLYGFREQCTFGVWVYRLVVNACMDELRRRKRRKNVSLEALGENGVQIESSGMTPDAAHENEQLKKTIEKALDSLDAEYRAAVVLRDVQGFSYQEIARLTGVSLGTVKSRISRARGMLQKTLKEMGYMPST